MKIFDGHLVIAQLFRKMADKNERLKKIWWTLIFLCFFSFLLFSYPWMKKIEGNEIDVQYRLYEKDILIRDWILIRDLSSLCKFRTRFKLEFKFKIRSELEI